MISDADAATVERVLLKYHANGESAKFLRDLEEYCEELDRVVDDMRLSVERALKPEFQLIEGGKTDG